MDASNKNYDTINHRNDDINWIKWYIHDSEKNLNKLPAIDKIFLPNKFYFIDNSPLYNKKIVLSGRYQWGGLDDEIIREHSEIFIDRGKNICAVVIGSDFTYNHTQIQQDIEKRLSNSFAKTISEVLDSDLYISAYPNKNNYCSIFSLYHILKQIQKIKTYDKIYVMFELSCPSLCFTAWPRIQENNDYFLWFLGAHIGEGDPEWGYDFKVNLQTYFDLYEWASVDQIKTIIKQFDNIKLGIWKHNHSVFNKNHVYQNSFTEYFYKNSSPYVNSTWWFNEQYDKIYM